MMISSWMPTDSHKVSQGKSLYGTNSLIQPLGKPCGLRLLPNNQVLSVCRQNLRIYDVASFSTPQGHTQRDVLPVWEYSIQRGSRLPEISNIYWADSSGQYTSLAVSVYSDDHLYHVSNLHDCLTLPKVHHQPDPGLAAKDAKFAGRHALWWVRQSTHWELYIWSQTGSPELVSGWNGASPFYTAVDELSARFCTLHRHFVNKKNEHKELFVWSLS
jgi:hypothetical protein